MSQSSVSLPTKLRRRIKKLAAERDVTQAQIVEEAIDLLEKVQHNTNDQWTPEERASLDALCVEIYKKDSKRKKRAEILDKSRPSIDDFIITSWNSSIDEP